MRAVPARYVAGHRLNTFVHPSAHRVEGFAELKDEVKRITLFQRITGKGVVIGGITFYLRIADFLHRSVHQVVRILVWREHIEQDAGIIPLGEGVTLQGGPTGSGEFRLNPGIGHVNSILPDLRALCALVDARTIALVGEVLSSGIHL